ncbi:immunoglobulin i-set domain-containing protein [Ditylenchus destructor]|nr:immunoglobulin i-set domain-containing protein [Ditylenchus destructor]
MDSKSERKTDETSEDMTETTTDESTQQQPRVVQIHVDTSSQSEDESIAPSKRRRLQERISPISPYFATHEPLVSYQSDREAVVSGNPRSGTLQETHVLRNEGIEDVYYTEEHWSSTIKSFITNAPPKFKQVIKAYRVQSTDKLTLVVEVLSHPPASFQWFCNDQPVGDNASEQEEQKAKFTVRHGTNVTTLTVEGPPQGVYSCSAKNPAGISKSYGYITVNDSKDYKNASVDEADLSSVTTVIGPVAEDAPATKRLSKRPPRFLNQIPHFVLRPTDEAVIDVEVESSASPVKFTWYVDGKQVSESKDEEHSRVTFYNPKPTRCVALYRVPVQSGQYTVVAQNEYGAAKSSGFIEVQNDPASESHLNLLQIYAEPPSAWIPPLPPGMLSPAGQKHAPSITKTTVHTTTMVHRSSSVPRTGDAPDEEEQKATIARLLRRSATPEGSATYSRQNSQQGQQQPQAPVFLNQLPQEITLQPNERLVLTAEVSAQPPAAIIWGVDGQAVEVWLENYQLLNQDNRSTLVVEPPVRQGLYSATVSNQFGRASFQTVVQHGHHEQTFEESKKSGKDFLEEVTRVVRTSVEREEILHGEEESDGELEDSGDQVYIRTYTDSLQPQTGEKVMEAEVPQLPQILIPIITSAPERQIFVPGGLPLVLDLRVHSPASPPSIRWYHRNFEIRPSSNVTIEAESPEHCRVVYANPPEGVFKAVVTNEYGIASYEVKALVEFPGGKPSPDEAPAFMKRKGSAGSSADQPVFKVEKRRSIPEAKETLARAPKFIAPLPEMYRIKEDQPFVIEVKCDAMPEAQFQWRQNNFEAKSGKTVQIDRVAENHSKATFLKPVEGRYEVVASNSVGKATASTKVVIEYGQEIAGPEVEKKKPDYEEQTVQDKMPQISADTEQLTQNPPRFLETLAEKFGGQSHISLSSGAELVVEVNVSEENTPGCMFQWFLDNRLLPPECIQSTEHSSTLRVAKVDGSMCGHLLVSATNCDGAARSAVILSVDDGASGADAEHAETIVGITKEDFTETTNIQKQEESYSLLVKVAESLAQTLVAKIFVKAFEEAAQRLRRSSPLADEETAFPKSSEEDEEGDTTTPPTGEEAMDEQAPIFDVNGESFALVQGERGIIHAKYRCKQPCKSIQWVHNGRLISADDNRFTMEHTPGLAKLVIGRIDQDLTGNYECRAENEFGCALYTCSIFIKEGSGPPQSTEIERLDAVENLDTQIFINKKEDDVTQSVTLEAPEVLTESVNVVEQSKKGKRQKDAENLDEVIEKKTEKAEAKPGVVEEAEVKPAVADSGLSVLDSAVAAFQDLAQAKEPNRMSIDEEIRHTSDTAEKSLPSEVIPDVIKVEQGSRVEVSEAPLTPRLEEQQISNKPAPESQQLDTKSKPEEAIDILQPVAATHEEVPSEIEADITETKPKTEIERSQTDDVPEIMSSPDMPGIPSEEPSEVQSVSAEVKPSDISEKVEEKTLQQMTPGTENIVPEKVIQVVSGPEADETGQQMPGEEVKKVDEGMGEAQLVTEKPESESLGVQPVEKPKLSVELAQQEKPSEPAVEVVSEEKEAVQQEQIEFQASVQMSSAEVQKVPEEVSEIPLAPAHPEMEMSVASEETKTREDVVMKDSQQKETEPNIVADKGVVGQELQKPENEQPSEQVSEAPLTVQHQDVEPALKISESLKEQAADEKTQIDKSLEIFIQEEALVPEGVQPKLEPAKPSAETVPESQIVQETRAESQRDKSEELISLSTSSAESGLAPVFREGLNDVEFVARQSGQLKCVVTGNPQPEVTWFVDGDPIVESRLVNFSH